MQYVMLLDTSGKIIHHSDQKYECVYNSYLWDHYPESVHADAARQAYASAITFKRTFAAQVNVAVQVTDEEFTAIVAIHATPDLDNISAIVQAIRLPAEIWALTQRERIVVELTADGMTTEQIARAMHITEATVATHRARARQKLGITTSAELTAIGAKFNWMRLVAGIDRLLY